jgi:hypothetical protein
MAESFVVRKLAEVEASEGFRVSRIINKGSQSFGVVIPEVSDALLNTLVGNPIGAEYLKGCIAVAQDKVIRPLAKYEGAAVKSDEIGFTSLINFMQQDNNAGRLSKDSISKWFDDTLAAKLTEAFKVKMPEVETAAMTAILKSYKLVFETLAQREPILEATKKANIEKALALVDDEDIMANKLAEKLERIKDSYDLASL